MLQIRPLTSQDAPAWADLLATSFMRQPDEMRQLLTWFHASHNLVAWGAWQDAQLVAQYSCLLSQVSIPQEASLLVGLSTNMTVHPDFRGRGLVKQVATPVYETLKQKNGVAGAGFSNAEGVKVDRRSKGYGYQVLGKLKTSIIWLQRPKAEMPALILTDRFPHIEQTNNYQLLSQTQFQTDYRMLAWRFAQHPFRQYQYGVWVEGDEVLGVVVYRAHPYRKGVALLAVCGVDVAELLRRWVTAVWQQGTRFIHVVTTPNSHLLPLLSANGKLVSVPFSRSPHYLTVKPLCETCSSTLFAFDNWHCMGGDIL